VEKALGKQGFTAEKSSYVNSLLFPLALLKRMAEQVLPRSESTSDIQPNPSWQDELLVRFLNTEARWLTHHNLPFGLTVLAIGQKLTADHVVNDRPSAV
jgi:hypothetical protein